MKTSFSGHENFEKATLYNLFFNEFFIPNFTKESLLNEPKSGVKTTI